MKLYAFYNNGNTDLRYLCWNTIQPRVIKYKNPKYTAVEDVTINEDVMCISFENKKLLFFRAFIQCFYIWKTLMCC